MKNKLVVICVLGILFGVTAILWNGIINNQAQRAAPSASWVGVCDNIDDILTEADLIVIGEVEKSVPENVYDLIFTRQYLKIQKYIKGNTVSDNVIIMLQTGGVLGDKETIPFVEAPLLVKSKKYLLLLNETSEGHYIPVGGYQGVVEITETNKLKVHKDNKVMRNSLEGMQLEIFEKDSKEKIGKIE